jgi:beta-glucosidase
MVLLRNEGGMLPLAGDVGRIAVIGGHADQGVISGGGSSQVAPPGGPAVAEKLGGEGMMAALRQIFYQPSAPAAAIRRLAPRAEVHFDDGRYPAAAAALARRSDVAIVFATQWMMEGYDAPDLSLPDGQDALIAAVAAANPNTIVVLETGGPVLMPWLSRVKAVLEAWYPGAAGGDAIGDVLFGRVAPSGRLPISFPADEGQLPRPALPGLGLPEGRPIEVRYAEGSDVGYRWYAARHLRPLFAFGFGLSTSRFGYGGFAVAGGAAASVRFTVSNIGTRAGSDVAQVYLMQEPGRTQQRLVGWARVTLLPGQSRSVTMRVDPRLLSDWDVAGHDWRRGAGVYRFALGESAEDLKLTAAVRMSAGTSPP